MPAVLSEISDLVLQNVSLVVFLVHNWNLHIKIPQIAIFL